MSNEFQFTSDVFTNAMYKHKRNWNSRNVQLFVETNRDNRNMCIADYVIPEKPEALLNPTIAQTVNVAKHCLTLTSKTNNTDIYTILEENITNPFITYLKNNAKTKHMLFLMLYFYPLVQLLQNSHETDHFFVQELCRGYLQLQERLHRLRQILLRIGLVYNNKTVCVQVFDQSDNELPFMHPKKVVPPPTDQYNEKNVFLQIVKMHVAVLLFKLAESPKIERVVIKPTNSFVFQWVLHHIFRINVKNNTKDIILNQKHFEHMRNIAKNGDIELMAYNIINPQLTLTTQTLRKLQKQK